MAPNVTLALARFHPKSFSFTTSPSSSPVSNSIRALTRRCFSAHALNSQLLELDLDSSSCDGAADVEVLGLRRLEDVIHGIIVRRSAPDWLPFRPGSSYWVPAKPRAGNIADIVDKFANPLSEEETLSFTSVRGWPSSSFFLKGLASPNLVPVEVEVQMDVQYNADGTSEYEDEE